MTKEEIIGAGQQYLLQVRRMLELAESLVGDPEAAPLLEAIVQHTRTVRLRTEDLKRRMEELESSQPKPTALRLVQDGDEPRGNDT